MDIKQETVEQLKFNLETNLEIIRKASGLSVDEIAELFESSRQTIYNIEKGKTKMSTSQFISLLARLERIAIDNEKFKKYLDSVLGEKYKDLYNMALKQNIFLKKASLAASLPIFPFWGIIGVSSILMGVWLFNKGKEK